MSAKIKTYIDLFREFDPNDNVERPWATYVVGRNPSFKVHSSRRLALGALNQHHDLCHLFQWKNFAWVKVATKDREQEKPVCGDCGQSTIEPNTHGTRYVPYGFRGCRADGSTAHGSGATHIDTGRYMWRRNKRKLVDPIELLYLCSYCQPAHSP